MAAADPAVPDKLAAPLGGTTVLEELLARVPAGVPVAVVGPARSALERAVGARESLVLAREDPPGSGPAAAVAAGVAALRSAGHLGGADVVVLCSGDAPWAPLAVPGLVAALRAAPPAVTAAVAVDVSGVRQPLLAAHRTSALLAATAGDLTGRSARSLLPTGALEVVVPAGSTDDVDTPAQLEAARRRAAQEPGA